jgi:hypothetical protein
MSVFESIYNSIFGSSTAAPATATPDASNATQTACSLNPAAGDATSLQAAQTPSQPVDVTDILAKKAEARGGEELNWQTSIVDLLTLLDLDSSFVARRDLAYELKVVPVGNQITGTAEENIALLHAVMNKLEQTGGTLPAGLKG